MGSEAAPDPALVSRWLDEIRAVHRMIENRTEDPAWGRSFLSGYAFAMSRGTPEQQAAQAVIDREDKERLNALLAELQQDTPQPENGKL